MKPSKKAPVTSPAEKTKIIAAAERALKPPRRIQMDDIDMDFFEGVIAEFVRAEWTDHTLELAALLARAMHDMEFEGRKLRQEGSISFTDKGTPVANPRKQIIQMQAGIILSLRRSLSLNARAAKGETRDQGKRRGMAKETENAVTGLDDPHGLFAKPTRQTVQ